ncbi:Glycerophosphocholine_phosphodiesterase [Hexamita inflata]|uniref:Glycerophosphocholine phosphodiesterase n=1 Tax=Hexamita inflata TaxID=28002 RepID=A0AA86NNY3_9EUKA|nr:Glycerophosphocholine phosphodiesterase [Hexamita inflata]
MNPIYATSDATLYVKYKSSQNVQVLLNSKHLQSKKVVCDDITFEEFSGLPYESVTIQSDSQITLKLSSFITAFDLEDNSQFTFNFGDPFAILYVNNQLTGPVKSPLSGSVSFNPFLPPLLFSSVSDLFFIPLQPGFAPIFTVGSNSFTHLSDPIQQDFNNNGIFFYQFMEWNCKIPFSTVHSQISNLQMPVPLRIGHRGCGSNKTNSKFGPQKYVENSIKSFQEAQKRIEGVELDIILSKDKVPVIHHDFEILEQSINKYSFEELQNKIESICSFEQVLNQNEEMIVNVEIKYSRECIEQHDYFTRALVIEQTLKCIHENKKHNCYFSSFDPVCCLILKYAQNKFPVFFLNIGLGILTKSQKGIDMNQNVCYKLQNGIDFAKKFGLQGIVTSQPITAVKSGVIDKAIKNGLDVFSWGTVPSQTKQIEKQIKMGMRGLIYDMVYEIDLK